MPQVHEPPNTPIPIHERMNTFKIHMPLNRLHTRRRDTSNQLTHQLRHHTRMRRDIPANPHMHIPILTRDIRLPIPQQQPMRLLDVLLPQLILLLEILPRFHTILDGRIVVHILNRVRFNNVLPRRYHLLPS
nr:hypothetical protein [Salinibaculum sp. KK48]